MFRTLLSLAGLVAFLLIWWFLPRTEEEPVDGLDSHLVERSSETRSMDPVSMCDDTNGSLARDVVLGPGSKAPDQAVPVTERAATLRARLLWQSDGGPVAQARVEVLLGEGSAATSRRREVVTDDAGVFELTGLPRGKVLVHCFLGGWTEGTLNPSETTNLELHLEDGVTIQGVVVDERGVGIPSAAIFLSSEGHANLGEFVTRTLSDGTFRLRTATQYALIGAVAAGYVPSDHVLLETGAAEVRDVRLTMRPGGGSVFGTVTDEDGGSVPNARLVFSTGPRRLSEDPGGILTGKATRFFATSDAQGHYEVASLQPGDVTYACLAFGHATAFESVQVRNGEHKRVDIRLQPEAIVEGRIRKANGEPIENTWVFVLPEAQDRTDLEEAHRFTAPTDAHGRYRIVGLPQGASRANVDTTSDGSERATLQLLAGEVTTWNVDLALR
ncbi:MAG: carboxypeptidase regulatory-like domain-containing protein, partial [Planctomycetes bacterium]|nr:carboxypeptidase regulatory-like domain-containing protein [Planctomycetota bacterium]